MSQQLIVLIIFLCELNQFERALISCEVPFVVNWPKYE